MPRTATRRPAAVPVLLAALALPAACAAPAEPSAADGSGRLPAFGWGPPRMRAPSSERPVWLAPLPADPPRIPAPADGFRA